MHRQSFEQFTRYALAGIVFALALVMTPRALLDVTDHADSHEVPVDMLEPADEECLWCTKSPADRDDADCEEADDGQLNWLTSASPISGDDSDHCPDDATSGEPSA